MKNIKNIIIFFPVPPPLFRHGKISRKEKLKDYFETIAAFLFVFIFGAIIWMGLFWWFMAADVHASPRGNQTIKTFGQAKKKISSIYADNQKTFYCSCRYKGRSIKRDVCGYVPLKNNRRAKRVEWEHVVPASRFGKRFYSWKHGHSACKGKRGRKCARKVSAEFRFMEADLYNLVPAIGELNGRRGNYHFGLIPGEERRFGICDFEIQNKKVEPRPEIRGNIARIYFYMAWAYPEHIQLTSREKSLYSRWSLNDPIDEWERKRADEIRKIQGNINPFVE